MKAETKKITNLISDKLLQKHNNSDKRNNTDSIGCDDSTKLLVPRNGRKKLNIYN